MCEPTTIAAIGVAVSAATASYGVVQSRAQARDQRQALQQQQRFEQERANLEAQRARENFRREISQQRAQVAGRGFTLDSPSALALGAEAQLQATTDENNIRANIQRGAQPINAQLQQVNRDANAAIVGGVGGFAADTLSAAPRLFPGLVGASNTTRPSDSTLVAL